MGTRLPTKSTLTFHPKRGRLLLVGVVCLASCGNFVPGAWVTDACLLLTVDEVQAHLDSTVQTAGGYKHAIDDRNETFEVEFVCQYLSPVKGVQLGAVVPLSGKAEDELTQTFDRGQSEASTRTVVDGIGDAAYIFAVSGQGQGFYVKTQGDLLTLTAPSDGTIPTEDLVAAMRIATARVPPRGTPPH